MSIFAKMSFAYQLTFLENLTIHNEVSFSLSALQIGKTSEIKQFGPRYTLELTPGDSMSTFENAVLGLVSQHISIILLYTFRYRTFNTFNLNHDHPPFSSPQREHCPMTIEDSAC